MAALENGFDWADGLAGRNGTPTPAGAITIFSSQSDNSQPIEEMPDSPEIERAEQATLTHRFTMSWDEGLNQIQYYGRGTILTDSFGNISKVLSAKIQRQGAKGCIFSIVAESVSFDTPPDEFQITPVELGVNIIKYPRYFYAFLADGDGQPDNLLNQEVIRCLQNYFENPTAAYRDALTFQLQWSQGQLGTIAGNNSIISPAAINVDLDTGTAIVGAPTGNYATVYPIAGTDLAKAAAIEIIQKYWRNEETPYIIGYQIDWSSYYFRPQFLNPGGYVENPISEASPQLPEYFYSPDNPPDSSTIFDQISTFNPQCYSENGAIGGALVLSWLRKADDYEYQRTWFKIHRQWIGSPIGFWDPQLYNSGNRPVVAGDYVGASTPKITAQVKAQLVNFKPAAAS